MADRTPPGRAAEQCPGRLIRPSLRPTQCQELARTSRPGHQPGLYRDGAFYVSIGWNAAVRLVLRSAKNGRSAIVLPKHPLPMSYGSPTGLEIEQVLCHRRPHRWPTRRVGISDPPLI